MKALTAIALASLISGNVLASGITVETNRIVTATTFSPTYSAAVCLEGAIQGCLLSSATALTSIALLKEDVQQVEVDGYAFLAGEEMTLALEEVINKARQESAELDQLSDAEITTVLLQSVK